MNVCAALRCEPQVATHGLRRKNNVWTHKTETAPDIEVILLFGMWAGIRRGWYYIGCLFVLDLSPVTSKFHLNPPLRSQLTAVVVWRWSGLHRVQGIRILVGSWVGFFFSVYYQCRRRMKQCGESFKEVSITKIFITFSSRTLHLRNDTFNPMDGTTH